jgi:regulator of protease activity HflC (stomatin/prohibitin superfamily)
MRRIGIIATALVGTAGCITAIEGNEGALFYSASRGLNSDPVPAGWYLHLPWNHFSKYDLRWTSHKEEIHIHSRDGLHMNIDVVVVVRPDPKSIYALHTEVGPDFYESLVRPAVYGASRDASGRFNHLDIAIQTHQVEHAIHEALLEHLKGQHIEVAEVAIQHFDLPQEVEQAANRKAAANQLLAAKDVELSLAERDSQIDKEKRRGVIEAQGLEKKLHSEQELAQAAVQIQIEEARRKADLEKAKAAAEETRVQAEADAHAIKVRAEADKIRIQSQSQNLTANYVRVQAIEALAKAMSGDQTRLLVMPTGKDGLPMFFNPFLNPFGSTLGQLAGSPKTAPAGE